MSDRDRLLAVLGLGRMGTAMARRLGSHYLVRTWNRGSGRSPTDVVAGSGIVLMCLFDGPATREVLTACSPAIGPGMTIVNTATVSPDEATSFHAVVTGTGATYLHAPVMGSTPAVADGQLTILAGDHPSPDVTALLELLGSVHVLGSPAEAAAGKLLANGVLGDSIAALRRAFARGRRLGLAPHDVVTLVGRTILGRLVAGRPELLGDTHASQPAQFTIGALAKDLALLSSGIGTTNGSASMVNALLSTGAVAEDDDIVRLAAAPSTVGELPQARLDVSPEVVVDVDAVRPLHLYALGHATGDPAYFRQAFLPTAHIEGYRDSAFDSWDVDSYCGLFSGRPAADENARKRMVERLDVHGSVATATMTLHHGTDDFVDVFLLVRDPGSGAWWIANKAYQKSVA